MEEGEKENLDLGVQPLDGVMAGLGLLNHDLVAASGEHLTHKQVGRARKGRRLTRKMQEKVVRALNKAGKEGQGEGEAKGEEKRVFEVKDAFNYRG
jgi:hypothetical protein